MSTRTKNINRRRRSPARKRADAVHESSHAVCVELLGFDCLSAHIVPNDGARGECVHRPLKDRRGKLVVLWAGFAGEQLDAEQRRLRRPKLRKSAGKDLAEANRIVSDWLKDRATPRRQVWSHVGALAKARKLLSEHWTCVLLVAEMVLSRRRIDGKSVRSAIAMGRMVPRER